MCGGGGMGVCVEVEEREGETDAGCLVSLQSQCSQVPGANAAQKNRRCERTPHYSYQPNFIQLPETFFFLFFFITEKYSLKLIIRRDDFPACSAH